jgi:hypothetical protein
VFENSTATYYYFYYTHCQCLDLFQQKYRCSVYLSYITYYLDNFSYLKRGFKTTGKNRMYGNKNSTSNISGQDYNNISKRNNFEILFDKRSIFLSPSHSLSFFLVPSTFTLWLRLQFAGWLIYTRGTVWSLPVNHPCSKRATNVKKCLSLLASLFLSIRLIPMKR